MLSHAPVHAGRGAFEDDFRLSMEDAARWACGALVRPASAARAAPAGSCAGDIAAVTLFLQLSFDLPRGDALGLAASAVSAHRRLTPASARKNRSEARAVLEFGLDLLAPDFIQAGRPPLDLLQDIAAKVRTVRMADVRKMRSTRLQGAKGGRPISRSMRVLAMVRRLRAQAGTDDQSAQEFEAIRMELAGYG